MSRKIEPPHITGTNNQEQLQQVIRYLWLLAEQLNMNQDEVDAAIKSLKEGST